MKRIPFITIRKFLAAIFFFPAFFLLPFTAPAYAGSGLHYTNHWHDHQPLYWPNKTRASSAERWETAPENIDFTNSSPWAGHPANDIVGIFGLNDRVAAYQSRGRDALSTITGYPEAGFTISYTGALAVNVKALGDQYRLGYSPNWNSGWQEARGWKTTGGKTRMDILLTGFAHSSIFPLLPDKTLARRMIQLYKQIYPEIWGTHEPMSTGFWPLEISFSERMIPYLLDEGVTWTYFANSHLSRCMPNWPATPGNGMNTEPPNRADQYNPNGGQYGWRNATQDGRPTTNDLREAYRPHYLEYIDPETGASKKLVGVPAADWEGYMDGYQSFDAGLFDGIAAAQDGSRPAMVVLAHDGDNAWGGGFDSYMTNTPNKAAGAAGKGYIPSITSQYLADHPVPVNDIWHVEDGPWMNADSDFGSPTFANWNWPWKKDNLPNRPTFDPTVWDDNSQYWGISVGVTNRILTAESYIGAPNMANALHPENGTANAVEKAWHYLVSYMDSGHIYYGTASDFSFIPVVNGNRAADFADTVIGVGELSSGASDTVPPTIWVPQRFPYNPGSNNYGVAYNWRNFVYPAEFDVYTFAYDASGLQSIKLKWRAATGSNQTPVKPDNFIYAGGAAVSAWNEIVMSTAVWTAKVFLNNTEQNPPPITPKYMPCRAWSHVSPGQNKLVDYYVEAIDAKGNVQKTDILHVWVGDGSGASGGGDSGSLWAPLSPTADQQVKVAISTRNVTGATAGYIHWGVNNGVSPTGWKLPSSQYWPAGSVQCDAQSVETPLSAEAQPSIGLTSYTVTMGSFMGAQSVSEINFVLHWGGTACTGGSWNNNGGANWKITVGAANNVRPSPPTRITVTQKNQAIDVSWEASTSAVNGYNLYQWNNAASTYTKHNTASLISGTSYGITLSTPSGAALVNGTTYTFFVTGVNSSLSPESEYSVAVTTAPSSVDGSSPTIPVNPAASGGVAEVSLSWTKNLETDIQDYRIYVATFSGAFSTKVATKTVTHPAVAATITGLAANVTYYFQITARDSSLNESLPTFEVYATAQSVPPPAAPSGVSAAPGDAQATVIWSANSEGNLAGYNLYRSTASGGPYTKVNGALIATTTYTNNALTNGTQYFYRVTAVNTSGSESAFSSQVSVIPSTIISVVFQVDMRSVSNVTSVVIAQNTLAPTWSATGFPLTNQSGNLQGVWEATLSINPATALQYKFVYNGTTWESDFGAPPNNNRGFTVAANNVDGKMYASNKWNVAGDAVPNTPSGLQAEGGPSGILVKWSTGTDLDIEKYNLYLSTWPSSPNYSYSVSASSLSYLVGGLTTGVTYYFKVESQDLSGQKSGLAGPASAIANQDFPPSPPTGLAATAKDMAIDLVWSQNTEPDLSGYIASWGTNNGGPYPNQSPFISGTLSICTISGLTNGVNYYIVVRASDTAGNISGNSSQVSAQPAVSSNFEERAIDGNFLDWKYEDVKALDSYDDEYIFNDGYDQARDIIALYSREGQNNYYFRVDFQELGLYAENSNLDLYMMLSWAGQSGGQGWLADFADCQTNTPWKVGIIVYNASSYNIFNSTWGAENWAFNGAQFNSSYDSAEFAIKKQLLINAGWTPGTPLRMQCYTTKDGTNGGLGEISGGPDVADGAGITVDRGASFLNGYVNTTDSTGRAKYAFIYHGNQSINYANDIREWVYSQRSNGTTMVDTGFRLGLDTMDKYGIKGNLHISGSLLSALQWADPSFLSRIKTMVANGKAGIIGGVLAEHIMPYFENDATAGLYPNSKAIQARKDMIKNIFDPPAMPKVFWVPERVIRGTTFKDILTHPETGQPTGYTATVLDDNYHMKDWFGMPSSQRFKMHKVNGVFVFLVNGVDARQGLPVGGDTNPDGSKFWVQDSGLHVQTRKTLLDLARSSDQEQLVLVFDDWEAYAGRSFTSPLANNNPAQWDQTIGWIANHQWVETVTLNEILDRGWTAIDHGTNEGLPLKTYDWLSRACEWSYDNWYWGSSQEESFSSRVPKLKGTTPLPNNKTYGHINTGGTLMRDGWDAIRNAPNNQLRNYAEMVYNTLNFETAWHDEDNSDKFASGSDSTWDATSGWATYLQGHMRDAAIIARAAQWAQNIASGTQGSATTAEAVDADIDGENEYVLRNNKVYALFENDGGRLKMAFAYDPNMSTGAFQVIGAPAINYEHEGEEIGTKHVHAFQEMNGGTYLNDAYSAQLWVSSVTLTSSDGKVKKTIALPDNSDMLTASYVETVSGALYVRFGLSPNARDLYRNGKNNLVVVSSGNIVGARNTNGGQALLSLGGGVTLNGSFSDGTSDNTNSPHTKIYEVSGDGSFSISLTVNNGGAADATAPGAVTNLAATMGSANGEINLQWTAPGDDGYTGNNDATAKYLLRYATYPVSGGNVEAWWSGAAVYINTWTVSGVGSTEYKSITGLSKGTLYYLTVRTQDDASNISSIQLVVSTTTKPDVIAPNPITTLTALMGSIDGSIVLAWTAPGDDGTTGTAKLYDIRISSVASESPAQSTSTFDAAQSVSIFSPIPSPSQSQTPESLTITSLAPGVTYYVAIRSKDMSVWSDLSNGATARARIDTVAPSDITALLAAAGSSAGQISLNWTAPGNDGTVGNAALYIMRISSIANITNNAQFDGALPLTALSGTAVPSPLASGALHSLTATGLVPGATYWFAVRARDQANNMNNWLSDFTANATNFARAGLQTVTGFSGSTLTAASLKWTWLDVQGETGYQIVTDTLGAMSAILAVNATSYTETGLLPNQKAIRVVKTLFDAVSSLSLSVTQYTLANPPLSTAVSSVTVSTVALNWDANSNSTGTVFELRRATFSPIASSVSILAYLASPTSIYTDVSSSFIEGVTYYYRLRAINGNSIASAFDSEGSTVIPRISPAAITDLTALTGSSNGSVNLSWTSPKEDGASGGVVSSYIIKVATFSFDDSRWNEAASVQTPPSPVQPGLKQSLTIGSLTPGALYYFGAKSIDDGGNVSPIDTASPQVQAAAKVQQDLPKPPIYIAFLWHMHQPIYYPYENVVQTNDSGRYSFSVIGVHTDRTGPYTSWPYDAISAGANAGLKKLGASVSFTGSLAENIKNINAAGRGFGGDWGYGYRNGYAWKTQSESAIPPGAVSAGGGNARLDLIGFGYHHPLMGLIEYQDIRRQVRLHRLQLTNTFGVPANNYSKGIFPPENAFRPEMIPALADEGIQWVLVDNVHFDRTVKGYQWSSGGNLYEPNPADQINSPSGLTWKQLNGLWAPTQVSVPWGYQPHYVQYTDPATGVAKKIIAVPGARYEGNEDARGGFGALQYESVMSQYEANNTDATHPMLVVLPHDGDNYGGGSDQYYHGNFQSFVSWLLANPSRFVCTTIQDYIDMFPPASNDVIHVENGSWSGADNGDPEFLKWNGDPNQTTGYSPDRNSWSIMIAAKNRMDHAESITPPSSDSDVLNGTGNDTAKAIHYFINGEASDYWYWDGTEVWDSNPVRACNAAVPYADNVINSAPGTDGVGPSIYIPQREPYNPGGKEWGIQKPSDFKVWTFAYDVNGLTSVQLKYRVDPDGTRDSLNDVYSGGNWISLNMSARSFASLTNPLPTYKADEYSATISGLNNVLVDYYVEATDGRGNVAKSPIQHVVVGTGSGGPTPTTLWSPSNPTQNDLITISASQANKPGKLHWGVNNWTLPNSLYWPSNSTTTVYNTQAVQTVLRSTESGKYFIQLGPFNNATNQVNVVNFVFNYNDGSWDNNGGANWGMQITISSTVIASTPVVNVTYPQNNSSVSGSSVNVSALATDEISVTTVAFYYRASTADAVALIFISSATNSPYVVLWNTTLLAEDTNYILTARAYDPSGNMGISPEVTVRVNNVNSAPNIALVSPAGGEEWTGSQNILWNASDPDGDNLSVTLQYSTGSIWTDIANSIQNLGTYTWNTSLLLNATSYQLKAMAKDPGGISALSYSALFLLRNYPSDINDLNAQAAQTGSEISLAWSAPGADGTLGASAAYDIRYSTNMLLSPALNISSFNAAGSVSQFAALPVPAVFGTVQSVTLTGLASNATYYFAMRARDSVPLWSAISNGATAYTAPDVSSPSVITSLSTSSVSGSQIGLIWISPGDDGTLGTLVGGSQFQVKYSTTETDEWGAANSVVISTSGVPAGSLRGYTVTGLSSGSTYYFWIKTKDEIGNLSPLSNSATGHTTSGQLTYHNITVDGSLSDWDNNTELMELKNGNSFYFTWSSTAVYIAYAGPNADTASSDFFVVFDTHTDYSVTGGTASPPGDWDGNPTHQLPFMADYCLSVEGAGWRVLDRWNGTSWTNDGNGLNIDAITLGATVNEVAILRSKLSNSAHLRLLLYRKGDAQRNVTLAYPTANPQPGTDTAVAFSHFYDINLDDRATPRNSPVVSSAAFVDNVPPSAVTDLTALVGTNKGEINLSWASPGDDGTYGALVNGKFRIDYSTNSGYSFGGPSTYKIEIAANSSPGATISRTVANLIPAATYYFRAWTEDDNSNWSAVSNGTTHYAKQDFVSPSQMTALSAYTGVNQGQVRLVWIAPGDDGTTGTASSYEMKFSTTVEDSPAISDAKFNAAQNVNSTSPVPAPQASGIQQSMIVTGLTNGVTYYFAVKSYDLASNISILSCGATAWAQNQSADNGAPSAVTNLSAQTGTGTGEITLAWIAPGNDGQAGDNSAGAAYQLKYATYSVSGGAGGSTATWWNNAQTYAQSWTVSAQGKSESRTAVLLQATTYFFGIKTLDAAGNVSVLDTKASSSTAGSSNVAQAESGSLSGNAVVESGGTGQVVKLTNSGAKVSVAISNGVVNKLVSVWGTGNNGINGQFQKNGSQIYNYSGWTGSYSTNSINNQSFNGGDTVSVQLTQDGVVYIDYFVIEGAFGGSSVSQQANAVSATENDITPPSAVTTFSAAQGASAGQVQLAWSSVGDDGLTGSIAGGKYRIDYSVDPSKSWSVNSYQLEINTNTSPGDPQGYTIGGLTSGSTYYFRVWTADEKSNWSELSNGATAYAMQGSVTIVMDGVKDAAWGTTPLAVSAGFDLPDNRARDLYVMSDANYIYVGVQFSGDPWDDAEGAKSAHYVFFIDTGTVSGTATDPWVNTTQVNWTEKPDIAVSGWINGTAATNFGGMALYRSNGTLWDGGTGMTSGSDFYANKNNDWAEFRISRNVLGVSDGQTIKIVELFRPGESKVGVSDSTPFDGASGACNDYGNTGSNISQYASYKLPGGDATPPAAVTTISAAQGTNMGEINLTWNMPGDNGWDGDISGGKLRIAYSSNVSTNFQISNYNIERTTSASPNVTHGIVLTGLSGGDTYYIRIWVGDDVPNFSALSAGATTWSKAPPPTASAFTVNIDGSKEASWSSQPNAASQNYKLPDDRARDVHVTNDANNLYVGFQFNGDPWGTAESNNLNAHYVFLFDTGTVSGTATDPWMATTQVSWANKPDVAVAGWHNKNSSADSINGMTRYVSNGTSWDSGTAMVSGSDFASSKSGDWAEFKVPLSVLKSTAGAQVRIVMLFRPDDNKPGPSDTTPFDSAGASDWGNGSPATVSQSFLYTMQFVGDGTSPSAISDLTALRGNVEGSLALSWSSPGNDGNSGTLLSGSQFVIQHSSQTSVTWSTTAAQISISTSNVPQGSSRSYTVFGLQSGDTYYFRIWTKDESNNWSAISVGATNWTQLDVTSPSAITTLAAIPGDSAGTIKLTWISPGDDGTTGTAASFEIRCSSTLSLSPASSVANFNLATLSTSSLLLASGSTQSVTVTGLEEGKTYYFAMRARDERGNLSPLSNGATTFAQFDLISPSAITDLTALAGTNHGEVKLAWTNPGDDATLGNLTGFYRIDYSTQSSVSWSLNSYKIQIATTGAAPLSSQNVVVTGLSTGVTYYFRVWVGDDQTQEKSPNWSALSNSTTIQSAALAQVTAVKSRSPATARPGEEITYTLTFGNSGSAAAESFVVRDRVPDSMDYVSGSIKLNTVSKTDASGDDEANYDNGVITVNFGTLGSGAAGQTVEFKAKVK